MFQMNTIFVQFNSFHIFDVLKFILHHSHLSLNLLILSHYYYNFYCEEASIKRPVVTRGYWPQWGRWTYFQKPSVSWSLSQKSTVSNQSCMWPSHDRGVFSTKPVISLLVSAFIFGRTTSCLSLRWSLWS